MPRYRYILDPTYTIDKISKNCVEQSNKNKYHKYIVKNALGNKKIVSTNDLELADNSPSSECDLCLWGGVNCQQMCAAQYDNSWSCPNPSSTNPAQCCKCSKDPKRPPDTSIPRREKWICDLTKMDSFIQTLPGPFYGNGQPVISGQSKYSILDDRAPNNPWPIWPPYRSKAIIRPWIVQDGSLAAWASYGSMSDAINDFNHTGCKEYYNMYKCKKFDSNTKNNGCPEWTSTSWNHLYRTPAGYCSDQNQCATGTKAGGYKPYPLTKESTIVGSKWGDTYFFGSDPKKNTREENGNGYLTIDYCNAGTNWISTDENGYLHFSAPESNQKIGVGTKP